MKNFTNIWLIIEKRMRPPCAYCWQTMILLSLFSAFMSWLATNAVSQFISSWGWIFLIIGVSWIAKENSWSFGPWLTGGLICLFIFWDLTDNLEEVGWVIWPTLSAMLASSAAFFDQKFNFRPPPGADRQKIVILIGSQLIISCWLQFFFLTQGWVENYPTILADSFQRSAFVTRVNFPVKTLPRGLIILDLIEAELNKRLQNKSWTEVQEWLREPGKKEQLDAVIEEARKNLPPSPENKLWQIQQKQPPFQSEESVVFRIVWEGPRSGSERYYIERTCQLSPDPLNSDITEEITEELTETREAKYVNCDQTIIKGWDS
ncbi:MAG: DUF5357 family protein [Oscillatoria sp. PMC 1051.18]|nr:DUF5357 family protein [Oscillatoria sp. PMC 1050.18]MEC5028532.1 DUF5357 family protein [Oscillatoria sp. PMC 1051.18]